MSRIVKTLTWSAVWLVGPDSKGPAFVPAAGYKIGLATRHFLALREGTTNAIAPKGKVLKAAIAISQERGNKMVWLEDLLAAIATVKDDADLTDRDTLDSLAAAAAKVRSGERRERITIRKSAAQTAAEERTAARKAAAESRKAAKTKAAAEKAAAAE